MEKVLKVLQTAEYWILPVALLGAIIGSFLNVVIFRLPLGLSISQPRWSFCPLCRTRIRPHHNLPIIGWLGLRGRCHHCRGSIARVYPVVECTTALLFVMVWDALFVAHVLPGVGLPATGWPLATASASTHLAIPMSPANLKSMLPDLLFSHFLARSAPPVMASTR